MSIKVQKRLLNVISVVLVFIGFVIGPGALGFWWEAHPRSGAWPLMLTVINLYVCVFCILTIEDYLKKLNKQKK